MPTKRLRKNYKKKYKKKNHFNAGKIKIKIIIIRKSLKKRDLTAKKAHELSQNIKLKVIF